MARKVMGALVAGALGTSPALADVYENAFVQQLEAEGFRSISTERTWLGRMRITAENAGGQREIIINPNNGEVLRDLWLVQRRDGGGGAMANGDADQLAVRRANGSDNDDDNGGKSNDSDDRNDDDRDRSSNRSGGDGDRGGDRNGGGSED